jgi:hypothetical protein
VKGFFVLQKARMRRAQKNQNLPESIAPLMAMVSVSPSSATIDKKNNHFNAGHFGMMVSVVGNKKERVSSLSHVPLSVN